ncbi:hypothetical protein BHE74_00057919 [Ensete ventricosum]|nr:hypothetical protein GW17_00005806 [Ensete ventricosum]RWW37019.1 hypothetical protein BHE74_00057919 [Ensete ventricosum]
MATWSQGKLRLVTQDVLEASWLRTRRDCTESPIPSEIVLMFWPQWTAGCCCPEHDTSRT